VIELYEPELPLVDTPAMDTLAQQFAAYHKAHPIVYEVFERTVRAHIYQGRKYISPRDIFAEMRPFFSRMGGLNNSYTRFYGDLYKEKHPEHKALFRERKRPVKKMALHYARAG
jgi:hypothetical protein